MIGRKMSREACPTPPDPGELISGIKKNVSKRATAVLIKIRF